MNENLEQRVASLERAVIALTQALEDASGRYPAPYARTRVSFGENCHIARETSFIGAHHAPVLVGDRVTIYRGAEIIGDVRIGSDTFINRDVYIRSGTTVGKNVNIGPFVRLITDTHELGTHTRRAGHVKTANISVMNGASIGACVTILGGVTIGSGSVVMPGSVVDQNIPPNTLAAGVPAKIIRGLPSVSPHPDPKDPEDHRIPQIYAVTARDVPTSMGALRINKQLSDSTTLEMLSNKKPSQTLVVAFHGALNRLKFRIPRFERFASLKDQPCRTLFMADPILQLDSRIQIGWYLGTPAIELQKIMAEWIADLAVRWNIKHLILTGSSGGGFAALQTAALIPGSLALVFNPRVEAAYRVPEGGNTWPQSYFLQKAAPSLAPTGYASVPSESDWSQPLGDSGSALKRYRERTPNRVLYYTNTADHYHKQNAIPFMRTVAAWGSRDTIRFEAYDAGPEHTPPNTEIFLEALKKGISWLSENDEAAHNS